MGYRILFMRSGATAERVVRRVGYCTVRITVLVAVTKPEVPVTVIV
jgi:hypothetical protein